MNYTNIKYQNKERPTFFFYSSERELHSNANDIPNASFTVNVPGLKFFRDFLSEEEVRELTGKKLEFYKRKQ